MKLIIVLLSLFAASAAYAESDVLSKPMKVRTENGETILVWPNTAEQSVYFGSNEDNRAYDRGDPVFVSGDSD